MSLKQNHKAIIDAASGNYQPAADGYPNGAHYTLMVTVDLRSLALVHQAVDDGYITLVSNWGGGYDYELTLEGRIASCRSLIELAKRDLRAHERLLARQGHQSPRRYSGLT